MLGAAVGGGTGKFVEKAWDSGEKWINSYFRNHNDSVQELASKNSLDFLTQLAMRINKLEEKNVALKKTIEKAQDQPEFSVLLQKALLASAQTDSLEKHSVLARLVADRLTMDPESTLALTTKIACDTISLMSSRQIKLLGIITNIIYLRPHGYPEAVVEGTMSSTYIREWTLGRLLMFAGYEFRAVDLDHLESLRCIKNVPPINPVAYSTITINHVEIDFADVSDPSLAQNIVFLWRLFTLNGGGLTLTGKMIGALAGDNISGHNTEFINFD